MYITTYITYEINDNLVNKHFKGFPTVKDAYIEAFKEGFTEEGIVGEQYIISKDLRQYRVIDTMLEKYKILEMIGWGGNIEDTNNMWETIVNLPSTSNTFNLFTPSFYIGDINVLEGVSNKDLKTFIKTLNS